MKLHLSVVIPAFNEETNIKDGSLNAVYDYLAKKKFSWEVLVVDDGSADKTVELAEKFAEKHKGFKVLKEPHRGKGSTVIAGVLAAQGEVILFTDMDQATPMDQFEKFMPKFEEGESYDVVIGSRTGREGAPMLRKIMAYGFALLRTLILRLPYKDTQCGFKAFRKDAARKIFKRMKVFSEGAKAGGVTAGFDLELLYIARKLKLRVAEVPVVWHHKTTERISALKDSWQGLRDLMRVRVNALLGKYKF